MQEIVKSVSIKEIEKTIQSLSSKGKEARGTES